MTAGYSGTPLPQKLGLKPGSRLITLGAPANFNHLLDPLPARVSISTRATGEADVIVLRHEVFEIHDRIRKGVTTDAS